MLYSSWGINTDAFMTCFSVCCYFEGAACRCLLLCFSLKREGGFEAGIKRERKTTGGYIETTTTKTT